MRVILAQVQFVRLLAGQLGDMKRRRFLTLLALHLSYPFALLFRVTSAVAHPRGLANWHAPGIAEKTLTSLLTTFKAPDRILAVRPVVSR